jgi:hypothetical protein
MKVSETIALKARLNEDWLIAIGLLVFGLALVSVTGTDLLGWAVTTSVYTNLAQALNPFAKAYAWLGGGGSLLATYAALLVVLGAGVITLGGDVKKFAIAFTAVFAIAYASWVLGSYAYIAALTPAEQQKFGLAWSLKLTNEGGFIVALLSGLVIANFFPRFADWLKEAVRPELYQDRDRHSRRDRRRYRGRPIESGVGAAAARRRCNCRGLPDLLGGDLLHLAQMVWLRPRVVGAACLRYLDLRRGGGNCNGRSDQGPAGGADPGVVAGCRVRRR